MSDDHESRIRNMEIKQATFKTTVENIKEGIEGHSDDMRRLFEGQKATELAVVTSVNSLHESLPCAENSTKIDEMKKKINGHDLNSISEKATANSTKLSQIQTDDVKQGRFLDKIKGGAGALDKLYKIIMAIGMLILGIMAYKKDAPADHLKEIKAPTAVVSESEPVNP